MHGGVPDHAPLPDVAATGFELRLHEQQQVGVGRHASGQRGRAHGQRDEGEVGCAQVRRSADVLRCEKADVGPLEDGHPRVRPKRPRELAAPDVHRDDVRRAYLQQAIGETTRRGAGVEGAAAGHGDVELVERSRELLAAARDESRALATHADRLVGGDPPRRGPRRQSADEHAPRPDLLERSLPTRAQPASHQFGIESAAHRDAQITRRGAFAVDRYRANAMVIPLHDDNPTERFPFVTVAIIALNVFVYLLIQPHSGVDTRLGTSRDTAFTLEHAAIPCELRQGEPATVQELNTGNCSAAARTDSREVFPDKNVWFAVFASMFLHGSILHLAGNMLFLWIFGNNVEDHLGHVGFTVFYFVVGVAAMAAHYLADPGSTQPVIGASGAIAGVMGAYLVLWPRARVLSVIALLFFLPVYLPAAVLLAIWFGSQFVTSFNPNSGVAWLAHVGGFVAGAGIALALRGLFGPPRQRVPPAGPPQWGWGR
jgi:membrane associated rhomboid family serine protease